VEFLLEERKYGEDDLAIEVIEHPDKKEQNNDDPWVGIFPLPHHSSSSVAAKPDSHVLKSISLYDTLSIIVYTII
jgi:hypothetical protein